MAPVAVATPQISWHARKPVLSIDVSSSRNLVATAGSDAEVHLWQIHKPGQRGAELISFVQDLTQHSQSVNVVRFSPNGEILASAGDDSTILLWQERTRDDKSTWAVYRALRGHSSDVYDLSWSPDGQSLFSGGVDGSTIIWNVATAKVHQTFRDHEHYVQGVAWDPTGEFIMSLSCDRTARIYRGAPPKKAGEPRIFAPMHVLSKYSQLALSVPVSSPGGSMNTPPERSLEATASGTAGGQTADTAVSGTCENQTGASQPNSDPFCSEKSTMHDSDGHAQTQEKPPKPVVPEGVGRSNDMKEIRCRLFLDDSVGSFFRRPAWSPDGSFAVLPCGQIMEQPTAACGTEPPKEGKPTAFLLSRSSLSMPCAHLPGSAKPVIAARFCPRLFELLDSSNLKDGSKTMGGQLDGWWMKDLPYRVVWAVATLDSIMVYDSQHKHPLMVVSNIHLAGISDIAWLPTGDGIMVSSIDGYCTLVFLQSEHTLGTPLSKDCLPPCMQPKIAAPTTNAVAPLHCESIGPSKDDEAEVAPNDVAPPTSAAGPPPCESVGQVDKGSVEVAPKDAVAPASSLALPPCELIEQSCNEGAAVSSNNVVPPPSVVAPPSLESIGQENDNRPEVAPSDAEPCEGVVVPPPCGSVSQSDGSEVALKDVEPLALAVRPISCEFIGELDNVEAEIGHASGSLNTVVAGDASASKQPRMDCRDGAAAESVHANTDERGSSTISTEPAAKKPRRVTPVLVGH